MKLIRFGAFGKEKPGVHIDGVNYDVSAFIPNYNEVFFEADGLTTLSKLIELNKTALPVVPEGTRLGSPVAPVSYTHLTLPTNREV